MRDQATPPQARSDDRPWGTLPRQAREALQRHQEARRQLDALVSRLRRLRFQGEMPHVIADAEQQVRVAAAVERLAWQHVIDLAADDAS